MIECRNCRWFDSPGIRYLYGLCTNPEVGGRRHQGSWCALWAPVTIRRKAG